MDETQKNGVDITDIAESLDAQNQQASEASQKQADNSKIVLSNVRLRQAVTDGLESLARVLTAHEPKVVVKNQPKVAVSVKVPEITDVVARLEDLIKLESTEDTYQPVVDALNGLKDFLGNQDKAETADYSEQFANLETAIKSLDMQPQVNLKPNIKVQNDLTELTNVTDAVNKVEKAVGKIKIPAAPKVDTQSIKDAVDKVYEAIASLRFPVPNYVLPFKDSTGKDVQVQLDASGNLPTSATISATGLATSANQTNASQKTQIVDGSGNVISATTNALDVNIKSGSSSGTQYAELATTAPGTGTLAVGRYKSTPPSLTDGQLYGLQLDTSGNLKVTGSLSVGGTTDNSAFTAGTSTGTPSMGFYHSTIDAVTDGRAAALAIDSKRNLLNVIRDAAGNARGANVTASNELLVSVNNASIPVTGTFWQATQPVSLATNTPTIAAGTAIIGKVGIDQTTDGTTNKVYVGNIPHVIVDSAPSTAVTGSVTANAGTNLNTSALALDATLTGGNQQIQGNVASAGTDSGNPVKVGGRYNSAVPTLTDGQRADLQQDVRGNLKVIPTTGSLSASFGADNADAVAVSTNADKQRIINRNSVYNGTTWDRLYGDATSGAWVNVKSTVAPVLGAGSALVGKVGIDQTTDGTTNKVYVGNIPHVIVDTAPSTAVTNAGTFAVQATLQAGAAIVGKVGIDQTTPGTTNKVSIGTDGTVAINAALPAGSNAIGKLAANSGVVIGDVNVATLPVAFNTGVRSATTQRVTIATDDVVPVTGTFWQATQPVSLATNTPTLQSGSTTAVTQATAANLNATVVGTGTFAVQADVAKVNGVTTLVGNGASGTGAQRVTLASDSTGQVAPAANATATGTSIYNNTALLAAKQAVNAAAGNLYGYHIYNPNSVIIYVQLWNVASGSVTVGTTAPTMVLAVPPLGWADTAYDVPITFGTALTVAATTTSTGSTAPTTGLLTNIFYK